MEWIVQVPVLFFSVMFHEVAHGVIALRHGDDTAKRMGRISFNPVAHIDPVGSLLLPAVCLLANWPMLAWAKPVPVDERSLSGGHRSIFHVAAAGPVSNLLLSLAAAVLFRGMMTLPPILPGFQSTLSGVLLYAVTVNIFLAFFNLIPIHPLDGSKVLGALLPWRYRVRYERHFPYGFMMIVGMLVFGLMKPLVLVPSLLTISLLRAVGLIW